MKKIQFSDLEIEWHPTKNLPLIFGPSILKNSKYWWLGCCGHEWEAVLSSRTGSGRGCPVCARQRVLAGFNDLATTNPVLAAEWHPTKNELLVTQIMAGSNKKVWWLGCCGHEWEAALNSRAKNGNGCPVCAGQRVLAGFNDLATTNPVLAAEWHPTKNGELTPQEVTAGSSKMKVWWLGYCGHEWETVIYSRKDGKNGCPVCSGLKVLTGFNDLATTHPAVAAEWHSAKNKLTAKDVIAGTSNKYWWLCSKNHEWEAAPNDRSGRGAGCPTCGGKRVLAGFNDLATVNPTLAAEWHPTKNILTASQVRQGTHKKYWWLGCCGHEWESNPKNRAKGAGCPICAGQRVLAGFNDLATVNPALAAEWHPTKNGKIRPHEITAAANKKVWWLGHCGHEWEAFLSSRAGGVGCAFCAGQKVLVGFNDLATVNPTLAAEWHPTKNGKLTPKGILAGSHSSCWWLGRCGHEWQSIVDTRNRIGNGCPVCSGFIVLVGFNDLASNSPILAGEWHPTRNGNLIPEQVHNGSQKKCWWLGKCGHEWQSRVDHRASRDVGCPYCSGHRVLAGFNDLATTHPVLIAEWHPVKNTLTAEQVSFGSSKKVWWLGVCGHEWEAHPQSRVRRNGCPKCSRHVSKAEKEIKAFLVSLGLNVESSNRKILNGKEIDLWIPEKNMGIEFNGLYWHTETSGKNRTYHYNKWLECKNQGIQLIQIWEDDWNLRSEIIMRALAHKLGVSKTEPVSRDVQIISISEQQAEKFLKANHLQGFASGSYYLGVIQAGDIEKLQAVMVSDIDLNSEGKSLEIIRYASIANVNEDFSTLLSFVINAYKPEFITVIADHCEANEELYVSNDFIAEKELPPDYMYVLRTERKPKSDYTIQRFKDYPALKWEEGLTEMELADLNGLNRIWDAGKTIYRLIV